MKLTKLIILILVAILITMGATQIIYSKYKYPSSKLIPMYVEVTKGTILGVNTRTDALYFGKIPAGDEGRRFLNVSNTYRTPIEVDISLNGDLGKWVRLSNNYFVLQPGSIEQITAEAIIPGATAPGNYSGLMYIVLKRV